VLTGNTDVKDALQRLNDLTNEEARIASAELLRTTRSLGEGVRGVRRGVEDIVDELQGVHDNLEGVGEGVQDVLDTVQDVDVGLRGVSYGVQEINHNVQSVRDRMDRANRQHLSTLLSFILYLIHPHREHP
jgi:methyl-accepting chemotaxis protein